MTTNTIPAGLQRDVILADVMRAFKARILPVLAFATRFNNVPLEGTDKIQVPYYPLATAASRDYTSAGYVFDNTTTQAKDVTINKRKYQGIQLASQDANRQPFLNQQQLAVMAGEKLAQDVLTDIFSVITAANFGAASITSDAVAFDTNDVLDLKNVCDVIPWPAAGRGLVLDSAFDVQLLRDSKLGNQNYGTPEAIRAGTVPVVCGFKYYPTASLPTNSENLAGFAAFMSAVLVGFSPIKPLPEVMDQLSAYEVVTDPDTGLTLEYRRWGAALTDSVQEVIECNYGYNVGEANALKRICTP